MNTQMSNKRILRTKFSNFVIVAFGVCRRLEVLNSYSTSQVQRLCCVCLTRSEPSASLPFHIARETFTFQRVTLSTIYSLVNSGNFSFIVQMCKRNCISEAVQGRLLKFASFELLCVKTIANTLRYACVTPVCILTSLQMWHSVQGEHKKVAPYEFCRYFSNAWRFLHEILHNS